MQAVEFTFPTNGMNTTLDVEVLPAQFSAYIENLTFDKGSNGFLRYGTKVLSPINKNELLISSLTSENKVATVVTTEPHGLARTDRFSIVGAYPIEYNVTNVRMLDYIDDNTFTYLLDDTLSDAIASPRLRKSVAGTNQNLNDNQEIIKFFEYLNEPIVAVKTSSNYAVTATFNDILNTLTIQNYVASNYDFLKAGNKIKINYTLNLIPSSIEVLVLSDEINNTDLILTLDDVVPPNANIVSIDFFYVEFYQFFEALGQYNKVSGSNRFFAFTNYRSTFFNQKLIIVNGYNRPQVWDGTTFKELQITETLENNSLRNYRVTAPNAFQVDLVDDVNPYKTNQINISFRYKNLPISNSAINGNVVTITTTYNHALQNDDIIVLNGTGLAEYDAREFIVSNITANTFDIEVIGDPDLIAQGTVSLKTVLRTTTINSAIDRLVVTLDDVVFPTTGGDFTNENIAIVYTATIGGQLPAFRYITTAHDRLWALGSGVEGSVSDLNEADAMFVYYTHGTNLETNWINPNTRTLPFINLQTKQSKKDQLNAIAQLSNGMVFIGKNTTQIWTGTDPTLNSGDLVFAWNKNIPVGVLHGNLVAEFANDVLLMSQYGLVSLSALNLINDFSANDALSKDINFTLKMAINDFLSNNMSFLSARVFVYPRGRIFGFRVTKFFFVYEIASYNSGWCLFTGDFKAANDVVSDKNRSRLILAQGNKLYRYGDHAPYAFADLDGVKPIYFRWMSPLISFKNLWGNQRIELQANATQNVTLQMGLLRYDNLLDAPQIDFVLKPDKSFYEQASWDASFWSAETTTSSVKKVKFATDKLGFVCSGYGNSELQLELKKIIFYGKLGR